MYSFEAPDLTRNPDIESITHVEVDLAVNFDNPDGYDLGPDKVIWQRGDPPLGTVGNELHGEMAPSEAWRP